MANGNVTTIAIPPERRDQLRALSEANGCTIADTIERLINRAITEGELPDTLPGYSIETLTSDQFVVRLKGYQYPIMNGSQVRFMAGMFEDMANVAAGTQTDEGFVTSPMSFLVLRRVGTGIAMACSHAYDDAGVIATMTKGIARDISRILRGAVQAADNIEN